MKAFETLVKQILLNETPSLVNNELLVDLNDPEINKQFLQKCLTTGVKLNNFEKWEVYKFKDFDDLYFCFIHEESVDAYAKFFIDGSEGYGRTVAQKRTDQTKGLLRRAFIKYFSKKGIRTNCTLVFSPGQAILAAKAGATYLSPFLGRLKAQL